MFGFVGCIYVCFFYLLWWCASGEVSEVSWDQYVSRKILVLYFCSKQILGVHKILSCFVVCWNKDPSSLEERKEELVHNASTKSGTHDDMVLRSLSGPSSWAYANSPLVSCWKSGISSSKAAFWEHAQRPAPKLLPFSSTLYPMMRIRTNNNSSPPQNLALRSPTSTSLRDSPPVAAYLSQPIIPIRRFPNRWDHPAFPRSSRRLLWVPPSRA